MLGATESAFSSQLAKILIFPPIALLTAITLLGTFVGVHNGQPLTELRKFS
jgi:hypothetical protein